MKVTAKVYGYVQVKISAKELEGRINRGATRDAMAKAARIVAAAAKRNAPVGRTGLLKKSIKQKVKNYPQKGQVLALIGPSRRTVGQYDFEGKGNIVNVRPAHYAHLVENGGPHNPPKPFLRPAIESTRAEATAKFGSEMGPAIERTAARIARNGTAKLTRLK